MEISSTYALQFCFLQITAMVGFSAWHDPLHMDTGADTSMLIFPQRDVVAISLSIFLLTYTHVEAKSNYHRGSTLILSYLATVAGFYFAPNSGGAADETGTGGVFNSFGGGEEDMPLWPTIRTLLGSFTRFTTSTLIPVCPH